MFSTEDTHIVGKKPSLSVMLSQGISSKVHSLMALVKQVLRDSEQGTLYPCLCCAWHIVSNLHFPPVVSDPIPLSSRTEGEGSFTKY